MFNAPPVGVACFNEASSSAGRDEGRVGETLPPGETGVCVCGWVCKGVKGSRSWLVWLDDEVAGARGPPAPGPQSSTGHT